jgi:uncharacterized membrane protein YccC
MASEAVARRESAWRRVCGSVVGVAIGLVAAYAALYVLAWSHEGWEFQELQLYIGLSMSAGILVSGVFLGRVISSGNGVRQLVISLIATSILVALWIYGQGSWCDSCGVP